MRNVLSTLKIGFDLDTILAATDEASISWYQERSLVGPEVTARDITCWDHTECLGVPKADMVKMFTSDAFFANLDPIWEAIHLCNDLHRSGAEIHIMTDRSCPEVTANWLSLKTVEYDVLRFTRGPEKALWAERDLLDFFIEDKPETAQAVARLSCVRLSFLRDRPYNRDFPDEKGMLRFYSWRELREFFFGR